MRIHRRSTIPIRGFMDTMHRTMDITEATTRITDTIEATILIQTSIDGITAGVGMFRSRGAPITEVHGGVKIDALEVHAV
jgi:hypothetical protein